MKINTQNIFIDVTCHKCLYIVHLYTNITCENIQKPNISQTAVVQVVILTLTWMIAFGVLFFVELTLLLLLALTAGNCNKKVNMGAKLSRYMWMLSEVMRKRMTFCTLSW